MWSGGLPYRGRISPEEAAWVREHLDEVQQLRSERGVPLLDPADPKTKERCGLEPVAFRHWVLVGNDRVTIWTVAGWRLGSPKRFGSGSSEVYLIRRAT
jgi:hypothetical protein